MLDQQTRLPSGRKPGDLLTMREACAFFGGTKPLHPATLYRGIAAGRYPAPIKLSRSIARWLRSECEAALRRIIDERDQLA